MLIESDENSNYSKRTFDQDYPNSSRIEATYESGNTTFSSWYNIISLGYYPANVVKTQKNSKEGNQYWIPDDYIVETEVANKKLCCYIKYISNKIVKYTIFWKENNTEWSVHSEKSTTGVVLLYLKKINQSTTRLSGPRIFGLDIEKLHQCRLEISNTSNISTSRKCPLSVVQSKSGQNKRFAFFGKDSEKDLSSLIMKHKMTTQTGQQVVSVRNIELDFNGETIKLIYNKNIEREKLDAIVRACDESLLARDGYRRLAAIESHLTREYLIEEHRKYITSIINKKIRIGTFNINNMQFNDNNLDILEQSDKEILVKETEIGCGAYRSIKTLLEILIPIWKNTSPPVLKEGDTINLKIGCDGRNVGRKQNHVMFTFCLLNEKEKVLKPDNQYCICLYVGREKYDDLAKVSQLFHYQLLDLQDNGIIDQDGIHWAIELFFCGDWKIMYIIMGLTAPNSKYFCLFCNCEASLRWDMDKTWKNETNTKCEKKQSLFPAINYKNYLPDELHLMLRISDILMDCLFSDIIKKKEFSKKIKPEIEAAFRNIKVHFEFFQSKSNKKQWNWTSLMGPDKKKMLEKFPVS
ncbi:hypothetical protein Glove_547g44 [Diversispora epigaea]|uniref:Uncharacterized protein n=1 Tax=Diversispora epigaea TaxID=1348612 RepID=A0A397GEI7_9GLOM|nr:hypothetical protein Glove_547g44 [Diversispora epigaea]